MYVFGTVQYDNCYYRFRFVIYSSESWESGRCLEIITETKTRSGAAARVTERQALQCLQPLVCGEGRIVDVRTSPGVTAALQNLNKYDFWGRCPLMAINTGPTSHLRVFIPATPSVQSALPGVHLVGSFLSFIHGYCHLTRKDLFGYSI